MTPFTFSTGITTTKTTAGISFSERLQRARIQLMMWQPFLASAVSAFRPIIVPENADWCSTMATDGSFIYVNPVWSDKLSDDDLLFVLAHEVLHCVLGHIDRQGNRNAEIWNWAIDYATNALLCDCGLKMPATGLFKRQFCNMTAEKIYDQLLAEAQGGANFVGNKPGDHHLQPGDVRAAGARKSRAGQGTMNAGGETGEEENLDTPTESERLNLRREMVRKLKSTVGSRGQGFLPGGLLEEIEAATQPQLDWRPMLSRFLSGIRKTDYRLYPFSRKHLWRGLYMPSLGVPGPKHLVVALDTSGSICGNLLAMFLAEIDRLRAQSECDMTLIQCDAAIQHVDFLSPFEDSGSLVRGFQVYGRGGTSFCPVFEWVKTAVNAGKIERPDAIVYLTDGYGSFPAEVPALPVLWVCAPNSRAATAYPFGTCLPLC